MIQVIIPTLGETISSGILANWHVSDGDYVDEGQMLYELETDKITSEGHAEAGGIISIKVEVGEEVDIGATVAEIDETAAKPVSSPVVGPGTDSAKEKAGTIPDDPSTQAAPAPKTPAEAKPISPAVRRVAEESGIDPATIPGSGKDGRVTKGDMLAAQSSAPAPAPPPVRPTAGLAASPELVEGKPAERTTRKKMTPLRKRIAERLVAAQQSTAMLTTFNEADMSTIMATRKKYQEDFVEKHGVKLGFMSFFIKAVVKALQEIPEVNAQIDGDSIVQNHFYDIGVAVGTKKGLLVPVVRDSDQLSFAGIEQNIVAYAKKAREGKMEIADLEGGCFTITNGGIYGSLLSTPILNMPQSAILGMHAIKERPIAVNGEVVIRPMMNLALSYDHRVVDGQQAVTFLVKIKEAIEDPGRILYEV